MFLKQENISWIFRLYVRYHLNICTLFVTLFHSSVIPTKIPSVELHIFQVHNYIFGIFSHIWNILLIFGIFFRRPVTCWEYFSHILNILHIFGIFFRRPVTCWEYFSHISNILHIFKYFAHIWNILHIF